MVALINAKLKTTLNATKGSLTSLMELTSEKTKNKEIIEMIH
jgi:F0F1-type ATP synthase assembly protein I